ncbi:MAG: hypothetical protein ACJ76H_04680 [Bacteriovoracaceae bacterium]
MKKMILLLSLAVASTAHAETIPGQAMLDYFSATCPSEGEWTQAALNDSRNLIGVIEAIKDDNDCKTMAGAFAQLNNIEAQMTQLAEMSEAKKQVATYDSQERELLAQISRSTNQTDIDAMTASLRTIQVGRAGLVGRANAQDLTGPDAALTLSRAAQNADAAFAQIASNTKCQEKAPRLLTAATGLISSIGGAITAVNPALGLGLQAGSAFMGTAIDTFRDMHYNSQISRVAEGTTAYQGYKCALETMTNRWCDMVDADVFIKFKTELRHSQLSDTIASSLRLNDIEIPVVMDWLMKVRSSAPPQNTSMSDMQNRVIDRRATIDRTERAGIGRMNQSEQGEFPEYQEDNKERWKAVKAIVKDIYPKIQRDMYGMELPSPFFEIFPAGYIPYYLIGIDLAHAPQEFGSFKSLDTWWTGPEVINPTLNDVRKNFEELIRLTRAKVDNEYAQNERPDPALTLNLAYDLPGREEKVKPITALGNIIVFMETYPPKDESFQKIYDSTIEKLRTIYLNTENSVRMGRVTPQEAANEIVRTADLTFGTIVLQARLELIVRISVLEIISNATPAEQALAAELMAADRFMETLKKYGGKTDTGALSDEIADAMSITRNNLNSFVQVFGKLLTKQLKRLKDEEAASLPTSARLSQNRRNILCHLILGAEKAEKYVDVRLCEGLKLGPLVKGAPETSPLTLNSFKEDLSVRGCTLQNYNRARKIYTQWISTDKVPAIGTDL